MSEAQSHPERVKLVDFSYHLQLALHSGMSNETCDFLSTYGLDPRPSLRELKVWIDQRIQEIDELGYKVE